MNIQTLKPGNQVKITKKPDWSYLTLNSICDVKIENKTIWFRNIKTQGQTYQHINELTHFEFELVN